MFEAMKAAAIQAAEQRLKDAGTAAEKHDAKLRLIVAKAKPLGAFETDERERKRLEYNKKLNIG